MEEQPVKNVIWAVDAFDGSGIAQSLSMLGALARATPVQIEPVFVLSPSHSRLPEAPFGEVCEAFKVLAEKRMDEFVNQSDLFSMAKPLVLINKKGRMRRDVELLLDHAKSKQADFILVATHGRRGFEHFMLGSFAEALFFRSSIPVITVNPEVEANEKISKILFPTTFESRFRESFEEAVRKAKSFGAELILYYKEPVIIQPFMTPEIQVFIARDEIWRTGEAESWRKWSENQGVKTSVLLDAEPGPLATAATEFAKSQKVDLIVMATQAEPVGNIMIGSLTKLLIRQAPCPVMILRA